MNSMNEAGEGSDWTILDKYSKPWMLKECEKGRYGKFALIQDDVRNVKLLSCNECGDGAVVNVPERSFDRE